MSRVWWRWRWCRSPLTCAFLPVVLILLRQAGVAAASGEGNETVLLKSTCNQRDCLRCDLDAAECVKCLYVIMASSRLCLATCPPGYSTTWPSHNKLMGRVCTERSMLALVSGRDVTIIAGAAVGGAVCVGVVIGTLLYMRRRAKPPPHYPPVQEPRLRYPLPRLWKDKRPNATEKPVADEERAEFLEQLACLRGEATNFLEMLNHTRTRFRSLGGPDSPTDTKAKAYRAVVRDLSRVLTLLNRREEHILTVPGDWRRLLSWAARVLARYKRQKILKENGELPVLDPICAGGGTLYQTRRQTQAQRCKLVQGAAPPITAAGTHTPTTPHSLRDSLRRSEDSATRSQMGSRSDSMVSLTPIIIEEAEDEAVFEEEHGEKARSRESANLDEPNFSLALEPPRDGDLEKQTQPEPKTCLPKLNQLANHGLSENRSNHYNHSSYHHSPSYDKPTTHCNMNHESHRPFQFIREQIMNLRKMEQRQEARNVDEYVTPEGSPTRQHLMDRKLNIENETQLQESPRPFLGPTVFERSAVNVTLPGDDVYTNVIRKPVLPPVVLVGDPYRDDTIERKENVKRGDKGGRGGITVRAGRSGGHRKSPRSCKAETRRQVTVPRCELTTDL